MQLLAQKITDKDIKDKLLKVMADSYSRKILERVSECSKSANEITTETGIPVSTVYRRIQFLVDAQLLSISGEITEEGKKFFLYKSKINGMSSSFNGNELEVSITPNYR